MSRVYLVIIAVAVLVSFATRRKADHRSGSSATPAPKPRNGASRDVPESRAEAQRDVRINTWVSQQRGQA